MLGRMQEIILGTMQGKLQGIRTGIANQNANQNGNGNVVAARAEGNGNNGNQIRCYNCRRVGHYARNYTVRPRRRDAAYLQTQLLIGQKEEQAFTSSTHVDNAPVYDSDGSTKYTELLESTIEPHMVQQNDSNVISANSSIEHSVGIVEQHPVTVEETCAFFESLYNNLIIEVDKVNSVNHKMKEANDELTTELARYKGQEKYTSNLQTELKRTKEKFETYIIKKENEYAVLWNDWYKKSQLGDIKGKSMNTQCASNTIDPLSQKLDDENVSVEFQVMSLEKDNEHLKAICQNLFDYIKQTRAQTKIRTDSLQEKLNDTIYENSNIRRPQPRNNTKNDRVLYESKSSCIKNKEVEVEEHPRNLLSLNNHKHMSYEGNEIKLTIRNDKSEVVCATCKQCLINANHDVCVFNYVNGMNSCDNTQTANVSNTANQKKLKPNVKKSKKSCSKERLASPRPRKPRSCLRWSPTGRTFDVSGNIIDSSDSECKFDTSVSDNASAFNLHEPTSKRFPKSTSFLGRLSKFVYGAL
ncbi:integrase, catalytic region, zinc finger, CCHC-type containing protein, partial [Tanacetum coccineum]